LLVSVVEENISVGLHKCEDENYNCPVLDQSKRSFSDEVSY